MKRSPYGSDVTDEQWRRVEPLIPPERGRGRHRSTDVREVVNAIAYRWATGCSWRSLPKGFPPWATVYTYNRAWDREGTIAQIRQALGIQAGLTAIPEAPHQAPVETLAAG